MLKSMMGSARLSVGWFVAIAACLAAAGLGGCGNSDGGNGGNAGKGSGGSTGGSASGASGSNGIAGASAGVPGSAGVQGLAGASNLGGSPGTAGTSSSAGGSGVSGFAGGGGAIAGVSGGGGAGGIAGTSSGGGGGMAGAVNNCPTAKPLTGGTKYCSNKTGDAGHGYSYELWAEGAGSGCMTVFGVDANYSATWNNVEDFLARIGLSFDQTKTPAQIGTISADFAETKTGNNGLVYVGIYGWTIDPLREYYILDDWGDTKPAGVASDGTPRDNMGKITVDGATYDVWKKTRVNKPAITGDNKTFDQYFSIRQTARQCGHISVSEHFSKWIGLGMPLGKLYEAKILVEAQESTGSIDFTTATVTVK
jgi:endo-1,4-beta-xylanase